MVFQKMFINVTELKAKIPKPIVEIKNVLLISTKLVLHEIKSFERYIVWKQPTERIYGIKYMTDTENRNSSKT